MSQEPCYLFSISVIVFSFLSDDVDNDASTMTGSSNAITDNDIQSDQWHTHTKNVLMTIVTRYNDSDVILITIKYILFVNYFIVFSFLMKSLSKYNPTNRFFRQSINFLMIAIQ